MIGRASLLRSLVLGTLLGTAIFGFAGRAAMRWYATLDYQPTYFTASGTLNVVLIAALAGAASGLWQWLGQRLFGTVPWRRHLFFWVGLVLLTWRVLNPISMQRLLVFAPLSAVHGIALTLASRQSARINRQSAIS